jgi:hypothetical protein
MYQGRAMMKGYFEGWYYKFADKNEENIGAFIPGVSFGKTGADSHAFIQFLDNSGTMSHYFRYDIKQFSYSRNTAEFQIGTSRFSPCGIVINVAEKETVIRGNLQFKNIKPWPVKLLAPGAMGWYAFVPSMECYHGVVSFDHEISGQLEFNGKAVDMNGGRGYTEKDWGRSFPDYHIWIQTNHFEQPGHSLMVSIASIPWLGRKFDGFLIGFWHDNRLHRFTTYTGAKIKVFHYDQEKLIIHAQDQRHRLEIETHYRKGAELRVPVVGEMQGRLSESLTAETKVRLFELKNQETLVFAGTGRHSGLEIEGKLPAKLTH